jgi:6-phosphofructokinase 1
VEFEQAVTEDGLVLQTSERDSFGHIRLGGIGKVLAEEIERITGFETRFVILGHIQRGGSPTAFDRVLGTRLGAYAVDMIARGEFGSMAALRGNQIVSVPLGEATSRNKKVDKALYEIAATFFD